MAELPVDDEAVRIAAAGVVGSCKQGI